MKFREALNPVLASPGKLGLLRTMFASPDLHWTGRELARAAGVSIAQAARDLRDLSDTSLVTRDVVGRSYSWRLNLAHVLAPVLADLFRGEANLRSDLLREVSQGLRRVPVDRARIFGSIPRGEERNDSDIDLFLQIRNPNERRRVEEALDRIRSHLWDRFGNPVSGLIYTRAEVSRPRNSALLRRIEEEGLDVLGEV